MKPTTILILGVAVLATPALAQSAAPTTGAMTGAKSSAMNNSMSNSSATDAAAASALSSVPDTQKKYKASSRAADFEKEAATTQQLNQQVASAGGIAK